MQKLTANSQRVSFLESKKTSSVDWLEYCHLSYSAGKLAGIPDMS